MCLIFNKRRIMYSCSFRNVLTMPCIELLDDLLSLSSSQLDNLSHDSLSLRDLRAIISNPDRLRGLSRLTLSTKMLIALSNQHQKIKQNSTAFELHSLQPHSIDLFNRCSFNIILEWSWRKFLCYKFSRMNRREERGKR